MKTPRSRTIVNQPNQYAPFIRVVLHLHEKFIGSAKSKSVFHLAWRNSVDRNTTRTFCSVLRPKARRFPHLQLKHVIFIYILCGVVAVKDLPFATWRHNRTMCMCNFALLCRSHPRRQLHYCNNLLVYKSTVSYRAHIWNTLIVKAYVKDYY